MTENNSLDPRISRLNIPEECHSISTEETAYQLEAYIVFLKVKENKPWESCGNIHAASPEMAILFAKEQYTRRGNTFSGLGVVREADVFVYGTAGLDENMLTTALVAGNILQANNNGSEYTYSVFYQRKRGKNHIFASNLQAGSFQEALLLAAYHNFMDPCVSVWICRSSDFIATETEDSEIWNTLPEKKYREVVMYKSLDLINAFKARQSAAK